MQHTDIKARISQLKGNYTRLALQCRARGLKVNPATVQEYAKEIKRLEAQLQ